MWVFHRKQNRLIHICTQKYIYVTPRSVLIEILNDKSYPHVVRWINKGVSFQVMDPEELPKIWMQRAIERPWMPPADLMFEVGLQGSIHGKRNSITRGDANVIYTLNTKSTDKRKYINDLVPAPLEQWLIRFLLEQTRIDWVRWVDEDDLSFEILNVKELGETYCHVNDIRTKNPSSIMYLMLSGLRVTEFLFEINRTKGHYQFNKFWYLIEIGRVTKNEAEMYVPLNDLVAKSRIMFPQFTLSSFG